MNGSWIPENFPPSSPAGAPLATQGTVDPEVVEQVPLDGVDVDRPDAASRSGARAVEAALAPAEATCESPSSLYSAKSRCTATN